VRSTLSFIRNEETGYLLPGGGESASGGKNFFVVAKINLYLEKGKNGRPDASSSGRGEELAARENPII